MVNFISEVESYDSECSVKRCLAAAVIVLAWTKVLTSVVSHPSLEGNPTVILTIFYRFGHTLFSFPRVSFDKDYTDQDRKRIDGLLQSGGFLQKNLGLVLISHCLIRIGLLHHAAQRHRENGRR